MNAVDFARIKLFLDCRGVGALRVNPRTMSVPVLEEHGDGRRPAPILALFYVRHIKSDSGSFLGPRSSRRPQERKQQQTEGDTVHPRKESLPTVRTIGARPPKRGCRSRSGSSTAYRDPNFVRRQSYYALV